MRPAKLATPNNLKKEASHCWYDVKDRAFNLLNIGWQFLRVFRIYSEAGDTFSLVFPCLFKRQLARLVSLIKIWKFPSVGMEGGAGGMSGIISTQNVDITLTADTVLY